MKKVIAGSLLLISLFTYPMCAYFFVVLSMISLLFGSKGEVKIAGCNFLELLILSGIYFLIVKFFLHPAIGYQGELSFYDFSINSNLAGRVPYLREAYVHAFRYWDIYADRPFSISAARITLALFVLVCAVQRRRITPLLMALGFSFSTIVPFFVSSFHTVLFRFLFPLQASIVVLTAYLLSMITKRLSKVRLILCGVLFVFVCYTNLKNVHDTSLNSHTEFSLVKQALRNFGGTPPKWVRFRVDPYFYHSSFSGLPLVTDEFNVVTSHFSVVEAAFLLRAAALEVYGQKIRTVFCFDIVKCLNQSMSRGPDTIFVVREVSYVPQATFQLPSSTLEIEVKGPPPL